VIEVLLVGVGWISGIAMIQQVVIYEKADFALVLICSSQLMCVEVASSVLIDRKEGSC
jgi:hypothetical protein